LTLLVRAGLLVTGTGGELENGWILASDGMIAEVGSGPPPAADEVIDARHCVAMPGLVNAHDHMYQWATRGYVPDGTLFEWLRALYPVWAGIDADTVRVAARAAMAHLLLSGCTLSTDHHYVFPHGRAGIFEALVETARELGLRFHPCRGSMSLGESNGGLPPDTVVEDEDAILAHTEAMIDRFHDPMPGSMCRVVVAPCSPFSVTPELMRDSASLARRRGVRLHTHLAETLDEERFCLEKFGRRPVELMEDQGWIGDDVWYAHGVHLNDAEVDRIAEVKTGIAHCPSSNMRLGAGACRVEDLVRGGRGWGWAWTARQATKTPTSRWRRIRPCCSLACGAPRRARWTRVPPGGWRRRVGPSASAARTAARSSQANARTSRASASTTWPMPASKTSSRDSRSRRPPELRPSSSTGGSSCATGSC